jgi:2,3-dihydroxybenzoate decarboxylase
MTSGVRQYNNLSHLEKLNILQPQDLSILEQNKQSNMSARPTMMPAKMPLLGKVALEEAFQLLGLEAETGNNIALYVTPEREVIYESGICNIQDRLKDARETRIGYTTCSLTVPGVQGEADPKTAEALPTESNNWIYNQIKDNRNELCALAAVSTHNSAQAVEEMKRTVQTLGFHGVMVNNWQHAVGANGEKKLLLYDAPEYDVFWSALEELDVPLYIHPSKPERMPFDLDRTHRWLETVEKSRGMAAKETIYEYLKDNIWLTTSGQFSTIVLQFCISLVGADRIPYSVDYPYET